MNLEWVIEWMLSQPPLYYHALIVFLVTLRLGLLLERPLRQAYRLLNKISDWIDRDSPRGGSSGPNPSGKTPTGKRGFHTSTVVSFHRSKLVEDKAPVTTGLSSNTSLPSISKGKVFAKFGRLPNAISGNFNAMLSVKARPLMAKLIRSMGYVVDVSFSNSKVRDVFVLTSRLAYLRRTMGLKGLTLYLKAAFVLYQQSLGGHVLADTAAISKIRVSRTNRGIPKLIPRGLRYGVRLHHAKVMKFVSSILNLYRDINFPGTPKLGTITAECTGSLKLVPELNKLAVSYIPLFTKGFVALEYMEGGYPLFLIWKSAPGMLKDVVFGSSNYSTHPHNVLKSLLGLFAKPHLWSALLDILVMMNHKHLLALIDIAVQTKILTKETRIPAALGKLHAKEEPAGKVRLFAIVDCWTQWALFPLHKFIFSRLRQIPQDGTHAQLAPLELLLERKPKELFSLDLTAATDRLPLFLQKTLITLLCGEGFANSWATLLVGRTYGFRQLGYERWHGSYKYGTGQPMGAYSSWGMLALTHHFIVQASAWMAGVVPIGTWFEDYALLGDDLVIANKRVADQYLIILKDLGMEVNLSKSLLSPAGTCLEFAKRTIFVYPSGLWVDISPVPVKEMAASQGLLPALVQFGIKYQLATPQLLQAFGFGWRNISWLSKPLGKLSAQIRTIVLGIHIPKSAEDLFGFFNMGAPKMAKYTHNLIELGINFKHLTIKKYVPKVAAKVAAGEAVLARKAELIEMMTRTFYWTIVEKLLPDRYLMLNERIIRSELLSEEHPVLEWFDFIATIGSMPKAERLILRGIDTYWEGLPAFYSALWTALYGPALASYMDVVNDALFNIEAMGGKHRSSSMLVLPSFVNTANKESYGFFHRYYDFITSLESLALASPAALSFERPEGSEGFSGSIDAVTPIHIRYYRMWAGVIQGTLPLQDVGLKPKHIPAPGLVPSAVAELPPDEDEDY